jgi:hypothetical protein
MTRPTTSVGREVLERGELSAGADSSASASAAAVAAALSWALPLFVAAAGTTTCDGGRALVKLVQLDKVDPLLAS